MSAPNPANDQEHQNAGAVTPIESIHSDALTLRGLLEAMDHLRDLIGQEGMPIEALISSGLPLSRKIEQALSRVIEA